MRENFVEADLGLVAATGRPVGDERKARIVDAELARERGFGHAGHADEIAAVAAHARDFGARFQPRTLRRAVAAAVDDGDRRPRLRRIEQAPRASRRVRLAEIDVLRLRRRRRR